MNVTITPAALGGAVTPPPSKSKAQWGGANIH